MLPFMVALLTAASRLASTCRHSLARLRVVTKHACSGGGRGPGRPVCPTSFSATTLLLGARQWEPCLPQPLAPMPPSLCLPAGPHESLPQLWLQP